MRKDLRARHAGSQIGEFICCRACVEAVPSRQPWTLQVEQPRKQRESVCDLMNRYYPCKRTTAELIRNPIPQRVTNVISIRFTRSVRTCTPGKENLSAVTTPLRFEITSAFTSRADRLSANLISRFLHNPTKCDVPRLRDSPEGATAAPNPTSRSFSGL